MSNLARSRAWVDVDLDALRHNFLTVRSAAGRGTGVVAMVKADAYGLGMVGVARVLVVDSNILYVGGDFTTVWDLVGPAARDALREDVLLREVAEPEILTVALGEYPRLRGAAALISSPAFAAPVIS